MHLETGYSAKNLQIRRSLFASYGTHTMNYLASLGILMRQGHRAQWVAKCYIWLDSGCPEYGRPIKTNAFTLKLSQKSLRRKLVGRKNDYKTLHRSHKFDTQNSPTVVTRIDTPKSGCYLHSKYIMGVKDKKENIRWYVDLNAHHLMYNPHPYPLNHQGLTAHTGWF